MLTGADVDAIAGLLHRREHQQFTLYASERGRDVLKANLIFNVLAVRKALGPAARPVVRASACQR